MNANTAESQETPAQRVDALTDDECRIALVRLISSILATGGTREAPDVLHRARLLSQFEVYDADAKWTDLEDEVSRALEDTYAVARATVSHLRRA